MRESETVRGMSTGAPRREERKRLGRCEAVAVPCGVVTVLSWWTERARRARVYAVA